MSTLTHACACSSRRTSGPTLPSLTLQVSGEEVKRGGLAVHVCCRLFEVRRERPARNLLQKQQEWGPSRLPRDEEGKGPAQAGWRLPQATWLGCSFLPGNGQYRSEQCVFLDAVAAHDGACQEITLAIIQPNNARPKASGPIDWTCILCYWNVPLDKK